jgi:hypothetical protein
LWTESLQVLTIGNWPSLQSLPLGVGDSELPKVYLNLHYFCGLEEMDVFVRVIGQTELPFNLSIVVTNNIISSNREKLNIRR